MRAHFSCPLASGSARGDRGGDVGDGDVGDWRRRGGEAVHEGGEIVGEFFQAGAQGAAAGEEAPEPERTGDCREQPAHDLSQTDRGMRFAVGELRG